MLGMYTIFFVCLLSFSGHERYPQNVELKIVKDLFRLRNDHKADSAELYYADTVAVYMKYLRNVPKQVITRSDKNFWRSHPGNKFEMVAPLQLVTRSGSTTVFVYGKEFLDGKSFQYEKIEIRFNPDKKIVYYRGFRWKNK